MILINNEFDNVMLLWKNNRVSCVNLNWCIVETSSNSYEAIFHKRVKFIDIATLLHCNFPVLCFFSDVTKGLHVFFEAFCTYFIMTSSASLISHTVKGTISPLPDWKLIFLFSLRSWLCLRFMPRPFSNESMKRIFQRIC